MPWKPPSVGDSRRTERWNRLSRQTRKEEPLCRLCLAAGRVEPATVVDHIVPLAEGGTHATENLMPLCKRCHDTIKTPDDNSRMARRIPVNATLVWPSVRSAVPATMNAIELRFSLAEKVGMDAAADLSAASLEGVARAARDGHLNIRSVSLVIDDSHLAGRLATCYGVSIEESINADQAKAEGRYAEWIEAARSIERARRTKHAKGDQVDRAGSG